MVLEILRNLGTSNTLSSYPNWPNVIVKYLVDENPIISFPFNKFLYCQLTGIHTQFGIRVAFQDLLEYLGLIDVRGNDI